MCKACEAGKYSEAGVGQVSASVCTSCEAGKYSPFGPGQASASVCKACEVGKYKAGVGQTTPCEACGAGAYQDQVAQASCKTCEAGYWCPVDVADDGQDVTSITGLSGSRKWEYGV